MLLLSDLYFIVSVAITLIWQAMKETQYHDSVPEKLGRELRVKGNIDILYDEVAHNYPGYVFGLEDDPQSVLSCSFSAQ